MRVIRRDVLWPVVLCLVVLQAVLALTTVHRESLTWDEGDHMFAAYMMWKTADYGLNPEHPPLVKLLAAVPILGETLWVPPLQGREFKQEAYLDGREWLAHNDGGSGRMVFRMRASAELLALGLSLMVFFAARAWFGDLAGLVALVLVVFDPSVLANSALVTTDIGVSLFFLATVFAFWRYAIHPTWSRLLVAGVVTGLLLATKHSGILVAPMLFLLIGYEISFARREDRRLVALRLLRGVAVMTVVSVVVLWAFYGFRYGARPAGLQLSTSLAKYASPLKPFSQGVVMGVARLHLLPESYLMGLVDVKRMAEFYPTFLFGKVLPHGRWYYFPAVILIKSTLGLLGLLVLAVVAVVTRRLKGQRELVYALVPPVAYLAIAMASGMNIGSRHLLPMYTFLFAVAGAGVAALSRVNRGWTVACAVLVGAHVVSSMLVFPAQMAYANEAWGGPDNLHNLLSDASVDWAQQLLQVKRWQDRHPNEECWFAYFAYPEIYPSTYGIRCHMLPTADSMGTDGAALIPPVIHGAVLISAGDLSGCEWPSSDVNPYRGFLPLKPEETIDHAVFVYRGQFDMHEVAALGRVQHSAALLTQGRVPEALALAQEARGLAPGYIYAETAWGDAALAAGDKAMAATAWGNAMSAAGKLEAASQPSYVPDLQAKLAKLGQ